MGHSEAAFEATVEIRERGKIMAVRIINSIDLGGRVKVVQAYKAAIHFTTQSNKLPYVPDCSKAQFCCSGRCNGTLYRTNGVPLVHNTIEPCSCNPRICELASILCS